MSEIYFVVYQSIISTECLWHGYHLINQDNITISCFTCTLQIVNMSVVDPVHLKLVSIAPLANPAYMYSPGGV